MGFSQGWLSVDDRAVSVRMVRGTGAPDFFEVTLMFTWMDARPNATDDQVPLMRDYELEIATKE